MKKILQAFDGAATKSKPEGVNDMKKFVSIIKENANPYEPVDEQVISSFEEGSVGGDANDFLLAADKINDEVMAQVERIKINADEGLLRDMLDKFNAFMTSYHTVGKEILQPDLLDNKMGEDVDEAYGRRDAYQRDYDSSVSGFGRRERDIDDESNLLYVYRDGRLKQKMVSNAVERQARAEGFRDTQEQALKLHGIIRSKFNPNKWVQKQGTKWVEVFPYGEPEKPATSNEGLNFSDYFNLAEAKKDPCWKDYQQVGMKEKGGKKVPNCVPKKSK